MVRTLAGFAVILTAVAAFNRGPAADVSTHVTKVAKPPEIVGGHQCQGCHGHHDDKTLILPREKDHWKSSAAIFHAVDPHRKAYSDLFTPLAKKITNHLGWRDAHREERCLACHTTPALVTAGDPALRAEGVGCEACHGSASQWLAPHTAWNVDSKRNILNYNFELASNPAKTCAGCHVGDAAEPLRDMNHDMIAAGHPNLLHPALKHPYKADGDPLEWDGAFKKLFDRLPKHWGSRPAVGAKESEFHAAAKMLSANRKTRGPWPEFEEMECLKCHKPLNPK